VPPNRQQARSHHARQAGIAAAAAAAIRKLFERRSGWAEILSTLASYQLASARASADTMAALNKAPRLTNPAAFAGVSSAGFPLSEPIVATIDARIPAPVEPLPAAWWDDAAEFMDSIEQLIASEVADAGRAAFGAEMAAGPDWQNYVRVLVPPSCKRCVVLAGRIYRDLDGFERHPECDCVHWPVQDWDEAHEAGLVSSPREAFEKGHIRDLTDAETKAIEDGADIGQVINSSRGIYTADLFGRRVKAVRTTKRSAWRRANPSRLIRLRPESIYRIVDEQYGGDRDEARRLLRLYGYIS
jgi:hypothetical protein